MRGPPLVLYFPDRRGNNQSQCVVVTCLRNAYPSDGNSVSVVAADTEASANVVEIAGGTTGVPSGSSKVSVVAADGSISRPIFPPPTGSIMGTSSLILHEA